MEAALVGRAEGERFGFELEPVDAYGDRNPELIQRVTRKMLAEHAGADATFEPGDLVEFAAPNGGRYSGVLKEINDESALFDFNHPRGRAPARGRGAVGSAVMSEPLPPPAPRSCWRSRAASVPGWIAPSTSSSARWNCMARRSTCAMRSSTTAMWWKTCAPRARCSSTSSRTPAGAIVVFSAHGVSQAVRAEADARGLQVFDATCPLVTKVHIEVSRMRAAGREIIMIGHKGHPEVEGTLGQAQGGMYLVETVEDVAGLQVADPDNLAYVTQTTLSVDDAAAVSQALKARFPNIVEPKKSDICYATQNRQDAVKILAPDCDLVLVVGSPNSSNSNRLREVAERKGVASYLIDGAHSIQPEWLAGRQRIGVTAGASAPEILVQQVIERVSELGAVSVRTMPGLEENVAFPLPKGCRARRGWNRSNKKPAAGPGRPRAARNQGEDMQLYSYFRSSAAIACASRST